MCHLHGIEKVLLQNLIKLMTSIVFSNTQKYVCMYVYTKDNHGLQCLHFYKFALYNLKL